MTIKEEKKLMIIECIAMVFIILSTVGIEESNRRNSEWKDTLIFKQNIMINVLLLKMGANEEFRYFSLLKMFGANMEQSDLSKVDEINPSLNKDLLEISNKFNTKQISSAEFIKQTAEINYQIYLKYFKIYNEEKNALVQLFENKPKLQLFTITITWSSLERILNLIRITAIILAALLYLAIYRTIGSRIRSNKQV